MEITLHREDDGRWIAEIPDMPGVMAYGNTPEEAVAAVKELAKRALADDAAFDRTLAATPEVIDRLAEEALREYRERKG